MRDYLQRNSLQLAATGRVRHVWTAETRGQQAASDSSPLRSNAEVLPIPVADDAYAAERHGVLQEASGGP